MSEEEFYNKLKYYFFGTEDDKGFKKLIKAFNDKCKEIERLNNELEKQTIDYGLEIERLNSIIKEVRELLKRYQNNEYYYKYDGKYLKSEIKEDILVLLDKEDNNGL